MEDTNSATVETPPQRPIKVPKRRRPVPPPGPAGQSSSSSSSLAMPNTTFGFTAPSSIQLAPIVPIPPPTSRLVCQPADDDESCPEFAQTAEEQTLEDCQFALRKAIAASDLLSAEKSTALDDKEAAEASLVTLTNDFNEANKRLAIMDTMIERLEDVLEANGIVLPEPDNIVEPETAESVESDEDEEENAALKESLSDAGSDEVDSSDEEEQVPYESRDGITQTDSETEEVVQIRSMADKIAELEQDLKIARRSIKKLEDADEINTGYIQSTEEKAAEFQKQLEDEQLLTAKLKNEIVSLKEQMKQDDVHIKDIEAQLVGAQEQIGLDAKDIERFKIIDKNNKTDLEAANSRIKYWEDENFKSALEKKGVMAEGAKAMNDVKTQEERIANLDSQIEESAHFAPDLFKHQEILENTLKQFHNTIDDAPTLQLHPEAYEAPAGIASASQRLEDELAGLSSVDSSTFGSNTGSSGTNAFSFDNMGFMDEEEDPFAIHSPMLDPFDDPYFFPLVEDEDYGDETDTTIKVDPASIELVLEQATVNEVEVQVPVADEVEVDSIDFSTHSPLTRKLKALFDERDDFPGPHRKRISGPDSSPYQQPDFPGLPPAPIMITVHGEAPDPIIVTVPGPVITVEVPGPAPPPEIIIQEKRVHSWFHIERDIAVLLAVLYITINQWFLRKLQGYAPITSDPADVEQDPEAVPQDPEDDVVLPQAQMMTTVSLPTPASSAPTDGVAPGSDPEDTPLRPLTPPTTEETLLQMLPPLPPSPEDTREEIPAGPLAALPMPNFDDQRTTPAAPPASPQNPDTDSQSSASQAPPASHSDNDAPPPPPAPIVKPAPGFWNILADRPRPSIFWTLSGLLFHLVVYYFIYISYSTYQERNIWLAANDATRAYLHSIMSYNNSFLRKIFSDNWARGIDRSILVIITETGLFKVKAFKMPG
ncbi:uncharacterized protein RCO7_08884 [Rhynchosporium graminicola]|uniref:Uncharacterized protein n=1 Tax=Rhynchosporium graminicola TaxID=2792576 RepID=A0A1E1KJC9_9HELO|nr:uncharacterized protein RCO7_08884 [Rhynchosporium commune]